MKQISICPQCGGKLTPTEKETLKAGDCFYDCWGKCKKTWKIV